MRIVIVGNGVAGMEAALAVRAQQPTWSITIVSEESDHFFARTSLMYVLAGQLREVDIEVFERDAYARHRFERVRARATGLDVEGKALLLSGERASIRYDRLLIACGSRARLAPWPGGDLEGVGYFVTLADLDWLRREVGQSVPERASVADASSPYARRPVAAARRRQPAKQPVLVGGGLIGIEVAEVLVCLGLRPRFVIRDEWFWPMALDAVEAKWIAEHMRGHGVDVDLSSEVQRLVGDAAGAVTSVETSGGPFPADLVALAIGVVPNTDWLGDVLSLDTRSRAIEIDEGMRTSAADVLAAGDCAAVCWWDGTTRPEQLWYTARDQGRVAGARLAGEAATYARRTWYNSAKLFDVEYTTVGRLDAELPDGATLRHQETGRVRSQARLVSSEGRFVGANFLGRRWDHSILVEWIDEERPVEWVREHLDEASFDTEFVPPLGAARVEWSRD